MPLTISSPPEYFDLSDATLASGQPLKASTLLKLAHNAKLDAVRHEVIYMGFFKHGDTVPVAVSSVDGYTYSRDEMQYSFRVYSTRAPGAGFTSGQKNRPAVATIQPANTYYVLADIDDSTGLVALIDSYYKQDAAETVTHDGIIKVYALCQRNDVSDQSGTVLPPGGAIAGTIPDPASWSLTANLDGDLRLGLPIPANADYRFGEMILLIDPEPTRLETTLTAALAPSDTTLQVASSLGFLVGDYISIQTEVLQITGPGATGSIPTSTTWNVARAQKLSTAASAGMNDLAIQLEEFQIHWGIAPGYTLDRSGKTYELRERPGRMRVVYASLQLFGTNSGATNLLERSLDGFGFEPVVQGTLPGLRVADGHHALIQIFGDVQVTDPDDASAPLALPLQAGSIGIIYANTAADDGTPGGAPTGAALKGQLYIDGGGPLGPEFVIPDGAGGTVLASHLGSPGSGYTAGAILVLLGGNFDAKILVESVDFIGGITGYALIAGGAAYAAGNSYAVIGGGAGATIVADSVSPGGGSGGSGVFFSGSQLGSVAGRIITLKITQVGSVNPGRNLTVKITF